MRNPSDAGRTGPWTPILLVSIVLLAALAACRPAETRVSTPAPTRTPVVRVTPTLTAGSAQAIGWATFSRHACEWSDIRTPPAFCFGEREPGYRVQIVRLAGDRILIVDPVTGGPAYVDRDALALRRPDGGPLTPPQASPALTPARAAVQGTPCVPTPRLSAKLPPQTLASQVITLVNDARRAQGLAPLKEHQALASAAQTYSETMARTGCYAHTCPPVPQLRERTEQAGYRSWSALGENIYLSPQTPEDAVNGWLASPGHRQNILSPDFKETGVGLAWDSQGRPYWTQDFGAPR